MTNTPLSSSDLSKLLIFVLLLLPTIFFIVGIVPAVFLIFGLVMMKKNADFSHVETAARNCRILLILAILGFLAGAVYFGIEFSECKKSERYCSAEQAIVALIIASVLVFYIIVMNKFFLAPLRSHRDWIEKNGVFAGKEKVSTDSPVPSGVSIIKGENFKSYSVADELLKWAKLKEDGHITEEQYKEARNKLLQGN